MRLVSTVELMIIRERVHNKLSPPDTPPDDETCLAILSAADEDFQKWYEVWDKTFSQKYEDATFYRQSLTIQRHFAELFHNATALRGIKGPEDVATMPKGLMRIAKRSITVAQSGLSLSLRSPAYREGFKYGSLKTLYGRTVTDIAIHSRILYTRHRHIRGIVPYSSRAFIVSYSLTSSQSVN
jgi:hypothetical protein